MRTLALLWIGCSAAASAAATDYAREGNLEYVARAHQVLMAAQPEGNAFWSPSSLQAALAALGEGSRGVSAAEVAQVLHLPPADGAVAPFASLHAFNRATAEHLGAPLSTSPDADADGRAFVYRAAGHLWVQADFAVKDAFVATLKEAYGPEMLRRVDFRLHAEGVRREANQLIEKETRGILKNSLPEGFFDRDTRVAFAHVAYLRADWSQPFEASSTRPGVFLGEDGTKQDVPMMADVRHLRYAAFDADGRPFPTPKLVPYDNDDNDPRHYPSAGGYQVATLPYHGGLASMVVVLPAKGGTLAGLEARLSAPRLDAMIRSGDERQCHVRLPKFKAKADWDLVKSLRQLGLTSVFEFSRADLSGIAAPPPPLYVSNFIQKGELEVNERGTTAAVVTAFAVKAGAGLPDRTKPRRFVPRFFADRPFLYLVVDDQTGQVLFMGRVVRP